MNRGQVPSVGRGGDEPRGSRCAAAAVRGAAGSSPAFLPRLASALAMVALTAAGCSCAASAADAAPGASATEALWSLEPLALSEPPPPPPEHADWPRDAIDRFILARLSIDGILPRPPADARTLARRLFFDLHGLPPTPDDVERFVAATDAAGPDAAAAALVDDLLASPRFGEHMARLWLDVVRYADSNGFDWDEFRPQAWRFRDYVVRSFNADTPFDRFLREQLAGDELSGGPPDTPADRDAWIATGDLRLGPHDNAAGLFNEQARSRAELLAAAAAAARRAGLPEIAVAPAQGRFLEVLARATGARRILEIGTLAGYSTIWLGRALPADGRLVTLEIDPERARIARENIDRAGLAPRVEVIVGPALESLAAIRAAGAEPFDLVFIDADKQHCRAYVEEAVALARPGTLVVVDNVVREGRVIDPDTGDAGVDGVRAMMDFIAHHPRLHAAGLQTVGAKGHDGLLLAVVGEAPA